MNRFFYKLTAAVLAVCLTVPLVPAARAAEGEDPAPDRSDAELSQAPSEAVEDQGQERGVLTCTVEVEPQYEAAQTYSDGLAAVKFGGKWGYIDESGTVAVPCQYDRAFRFSEGLAVVGQAVDAWMDAATGAWYDVCEMGFVDAQGNYTPFVNPYAGYDSAVRQDIPGPLKLDLPRSGGRTYQFSNGFLAAGELLYGDDGQARLDLVSNGWQATEGLAAGAASYSALDGSGTISIAPPEGFRISALRPYHQGLAPVGAVNKSTGEALWGFVDRSGSWVIQPQYRNFMVEDGDGNCRVFGETGLAMVQDASGKWGAIDKTGNTVIPFQYDALRPYSMGLAPFCQDGLYGFLDETGAAAIPPRYVMTSGFGDSGCAAAFDGERAFLIDRAGNEVPGVENLCAACFSSPERGGVPAANPPDAFLVLESGGLYGFAQVSYLPPLPEEEELLDWAYRETVLAIEAGLVPTRLQCLYQQNITREEFCELAVQTVGAVLDTPISQVVAERTGTTLDQMRRARPFTDADSTAVLAACALGIINGRGGGIFDPCAPISRQEAAALLTRTAGVLGLDTRGAPDTDFTDGGMVGVWFTESVNFVVHAGIMSGFQGAFAPHAAYTREQSYLTVCRLFLKVGEKG